MTNTNIITDWIPAGVYPALDVGWKDIASV